MVAVVVRARGATRGHVASAVALMPALRAAVAPLAHLSPSNLKHGAVRVVYGELWVKKREHILEGRRAPSEAVFRRTAVIAAATILYADLATHFLSEKRCPQGQVGFDNIVRHGRYDRVVCRPMLSGHNLPK